MVDGLMAAAMTTPPNAARKLRLSMMDTPCEPETGPIRMLFTLSGIFSYGQYMKTSLHAHDMGAGGMAFASSALGQKLRALQGSGSTSNRTIAEHLLRNPVHGSSLSIEELAAERRLDATLSRFARALGYGGYPELRAALADTLQEVLRPVEKLRGALARQDADDPLRTSLQDSLTNLRATAEGLDPPRWRGWWRAWRRRLASMSSASASRRIWPRC